MSSIQEQWDKQKNRKYKGQKGPIRTPSGDWLRATDITKQQWNKPCPRCGNIMYPGYASIDHILPKSDFPDLMFEYSNFEVICHHCNAKKCKNALYFIDKAISEMKQAAQTLADKWSF